MLESALFNLSRPISARQEAKVLDHTEGKARVPNRSALVLEMAISGLEQRSTLRSMKVLQTALHLFAPTSGRNVVDEHTRTGLLAIRARDRACPARNWPHTIRPPCLESISCVRGV